MGKPEVRKAIDATLKKSVQSNNRKNINTKL